MKNSHKNPQIILNAYYCLYYFTVLGVIYYLLGEHSEGPITEQSQAVIAHLSRETDDFQ